MNKFNKSMIVCLALVLFITMNGTPTLAGEIVTQEKQEKKSILESIPLESYEKFISILDEQGHFYELDSEGRLTEESKGCVLMPNTEDIASAADMAINEPTYSKTNVQVEGVDEADKVKFDSRYIYTCVNDRKVAIVDTKEKMKQVADIKCSEVSWANYRIEKFFVDDKYLTVIMEGEEEQRDNNIKGYRYLRNRNIYTGVRVYDISDKSNIKGIRQFKVKGRYEDDRKIGNQLYLITQGEIGWWDKNNYDRSDIMPQYIDSINGHVSKEIDIRNIRYFDWEECDEYTTISTFNISEQKEPKFNVLMGETTAFYMNDRSIYLCNVAYIRNEQVKDLEGGSYTNISKYAIDKEQVGYTCSNYVKGYLLNQFSLDEYNGYLRLATSDNWNEENNVYVLDSKMEQVAHLGGLAKGENIYSVRFDGDKAYVVTFKQVDPLFVIDMSKPSAPKVLGELKVPGFSQYLHPIGDHLVVGIGRETDEITTKDSQGNVLFTNVVAKGIKLSLFDVTDPKAPKEVNHVILGTKSGYSEALTNNRAVMVDPKRHILAIPVELHYNEAVKITDEYSSTEFSGAYVFKVENGKLVGKAKLGQIDMVSGEYLRSDYGGAGRVGYIGDTMYYIYGNQINAYNMNDFSRTQAVKLQ